MKKCRKGIALILVAAMMMSQTVYGQEISQTASETAETIEESQLVSEIETDAEETVEEITETVDSEEDETISESQSEADIWETETEDSKLEELVEGDFLYTVSSNEAKITGYTGEDSKVEIPSVIDSYPVTEICDYAFDGCESLEELVIPESVKKIGVYIIRNTGVRSITIPKSVVDTNHDMDSGKCDGPMSGAENLKEVIFEEGMEYLPAYILASDSYTSGVEKVQIPDSVTEIKNYAFAGCVGLTEINFPENLKIIGRNVFYGCTGINEITIPASVREMGDNIFTNCTGLENVVIENGVTSIGGWAFQGCRSLVKINIPDSVTSMSMLTFEGCSSLTTVTIPDSVKSMHFDALFAGCTNLTNVKLPKNVRSTGSGGSAFLNCTSLCSVELPIGLTSIPHDMFYGCTNLKSVSIPDGVIEIGSSAFRNCSSLTVINLPDSVTKIDGNGYGYTFSGCSSLISISLPEGIKKIGSDDFSECSSLVGIDIPKSVTSIGTCAFEKCSSLSSISLPENLTTISSGMLNQCSNLAYVNIPSNVTTVKSSAFSGCSSLKEISIPASVISIEKYAFYDCSSLENIVLPEGITVLSDYLFYNCSSLKELRIPKSVVDIEAYTFQFCNRLTQIDIPEGVEHLGGYAFYGCTGLKNISIPDSVQEIGSGAFDGCTNLREIVLPSGLNSIESSLFYNCSQIEKICIPSGVTEIGQYAFYGCSNLKYLWIPESVTKIGRCSVEKCNSLAIYYEGNEEKWKNIKIEYDNDTLNKLRKEGAIIYNSTGDESNNASKNESVRFFEKWDAETQTAYFGKMDLLGSRVGEESDTSFINDVDKLVGHYVLVETKKRDDNLVDSDTLISIRPVDSKIGIVESVDSNKIVIGDETYSSSEGLDDFVDYEGEEVLYHVYEGKLKEIEILQTGTGELTYWNTDNRKIKIKSEGYLSSLADAETIKFLGKTKFTNVSVQYTYDDLGFIYHVSDYVPSGEVSYYDTYVPPTKEESILLKYAAEWNKAYDNYIQALKDAFDKMAGMDEEKKEAIITAEAQRMQKNDKESSSKYLTGNLGQYSLYAYKGLAEFFYENTSTKMGVGISDVSGTFSGAQLVNNILKACYNSSKEYDYDNVKVSISVFTAGSARFGDLKYTVYDKNGKQIEQRTVAVCSTIEECEASIKSYVDELKDLATTSAYNVASAVYTDILGKPLSTLSKDYLNKTAGIIERRFAVSLSEKFKVAGVGDIIKDLDECYTYYTWITKTINQGKYDNIVDATKNITSLEFKDTTIKDAAAKKAYSVLKSATNKLTKKCEGYIAGTVTGDSKCAFKVKFKCPVNVEVYNSDGEKIGYVDETDVWYTDDLEITDLGGAKEVCILNGDLPTFKVTSYDYGKLDCTIEEYNENYEPVSRLNYYDIDLNTQSEFEIVMKNDLASNKENLAITSDGNEIYADECVSVDDKAGVEVICTPTTDDGSEGGEISGAGMYIRGDEVVLSANTYEGYYFTGWYQGEELLSVDSSYEFTAREDADIEARFIHDEFIYIQAEAEDGGYVIGSGRYLTGEKAVLTAVPDENAIFMGWYNGDEKVSDDAEYEFDVSEDITLTAHFKQQETLEKVELIKAADTGKAEIEVSWKAVEGTEGYRIYRKFTGGNWKQLVEVEADQLSYVDNSGVTGKLYSYTVQAFKTADGKEIVGEYDKTGVSATKLPAAVVLKEAKSNEKDGIDISWNKVSNADGYRVYRKEAGGSWARIADIESNTTVRYTDKTAAAGKAYYYTVRAYKVYEGKTVLGGYDNQGVTAMFKDTIKTLETVELDKIADSGKGSIIVSWKAVNGAEGYRIYKKFAGSSWQRVTNVTADQLSYDDGSGVTGKTYTYTVRAFKHVDGKEILGGFDSKGLTATKLPAKVTLREAKDNGKGGITVSWNKVSTATGYRVYRKEAGGSWKGLGNVASNATTTYTDQNVTAGKRYTYTVRAYKEYEGKSHQGDYDKTGKTATVTSLQGTVKLLGATAEEGRKITVTWDKAEDCDGYIVYRKSGSGSWSRLIKVIDKNANSYTDGSGTAGTTYTYTVRAYKVINGKEAMGGFDSKGVSAKCKN